MKNLMLAAVLSVVAMGCAMKTKVMDVPVVSGTYNALPEGARLQETGPIAGNFCADTFGDKGSIGLFDEAIKSAQKQGGADFITSASFFREGNCISIEGTGQKVVMADMPAASTPSATPAPAKAKRSKHHQ